MNNQREQGLFSQSSCGLFLRFVHLYSYHRIVSPTCRLPGNATNRSIQKHRDKATIVTADVIEFSLDEAVPLVIQCEHSMNEDVNHSRDPMSNGNFGLRKGPRSQQGQNSSENGACLRCECEREIERNMRNWWRRIDE